jgi:GT2 family glycosyltransferase
MIGIVIPVHGEIDSILRLLESLNSQKGCDPYKVIVVYSGDHANFMAVKSFKPVIFELKVLEVASSSYWARSIWEGVKVFISELGCTHILFMNDDIYIGPNLIFNFELLSKASDNKNVYFSPVFDINSKQILSGTLNVNFNKLLIKDNFFLSDLMPNLSDLATGRCIMYPIEFFFNGGKINYGLFPHHYADIDLSRQATKLGYSLLCNSEVQVYSKNDFSSSVHFNAFFKKYFYVKSPDRLISWFSFWVLYAKTTNGISFTQFILVVLKFLISKLRIS